MRKDHWCAAAKILLTDKFIDFKSLKKKIWKYKDARIKEEETQEEWEEE